MKTALCEQLGIEHPIIQAAIGGISCPELAAAVSNAGGLGSIAMTGWGKDGTMERITRTTQLTNHGFVANLLLPYDIDEELEAILSAPPKVVSLFWGDIAPYESRIHEAGSLLMITVGSVEEAKEAADKGADIIVAQGWEAGGHVRGTTATMPLIPQVVDAVDPVPVVAAGGISDGRGLAAALCLGAQAAWVGTRFLGAKEADAHPDYRKRVFHSAASDTYYSTLFDGGWADAPGRVIRNDTIDAWEAAGRPEIGARPGETDVIATSGEGDEIKRYGAYAMRSDMQGDIEAAPLWAGQGVGLVTREQTSAEIIAEMMAEAKAALDRSRG
ncbi:MAG: NAD(P)H-dependent flavin oxidoreductase [Boseongicola sp.]